MNAAKDHLRAGMKKRRAALAVALPRAGDDLAEAIAFDFQALSLEPGAVVAGYWPIQSEINPLPLMLSLVARGAILALPALIPDAGESNGHRMVFRRYDADMTLTFGPFDIRQPPEMSAECLPDIVLTPLLAFDAAGNRLGYGGGYYDRALRFLKAQKRCMAIGLAFAGQQVDAVPLEPFDQPLDMIFTEAGVLRLD